MGGRVPDQNRRHKSQTMRPDLIRSRLESHGSAVRTDVIDKIALLEIGLLRIQLAQRCALRQRQVWAIKSALQLHQHLGAQYCVEFSVRPYKQARHECRLRGEGDAGRQTCEDTADAGQRWASTADRAQTRDYWSRGRQHKTRHIKDTDDEPPGPLKGPGLQRIYGGKVTDGKGRQEHETTATKEPLAQGLRNKLVSPCFHDHQSPAMKTSTAACARHRFME